MRYIHSLLMALGTSLLLAPASAHHSFMAEFDQKQPVTLTGVVTGVEWQNPHTFFAMDVKEADGNVVNWRLETGSPSALVSRGWKRETMKPGDRIVVHGAENIDSVNSTDGRIRKNRVWLPETDTDPKLEMENLSRVTFSVVLTKTIISDMRPDLEIRRLRFGPSRGL